MKYGAWCREFQSHFYHGIQSLKFCEIDGFLESNKSCLMPNMSPYNKVKTDYSNLIVSEFDLAVDLCNAQPQGMSSIQINGYSL